MGQISKKEFYIEGVRLHTNKTSCLNVKELRQDINLFYYVNRNLDKDEINYRQLINKVVCICNSFDMWYVPYLFSLCIDDPEKMYMVNAILRYLNRPYIGEYSEDFLSTLLQEDNN